MEILTYFKSNFSELVQKMKDTNHDYDNDNQNPYHLEGDVYTHTLMVLNRSIENSKNINVHVAALLHDIGKCFTKEVIEDRKRVRFINHEHVSTIKAIPIIDGMIKDLNLKLDKELILKLINWHSYFHNIGVFVNGQFELPEKTKAEIKRKFKGDVNLYLSLLELSKSDNEGRFSSIEKEGNGKYETIVRFASEIDTHKPPVVKDKEILMITGISCSGKSTIIEKYLNGETINGKNRKEGEYVIISFDEEITSNFPDLPYSEAWEKSISKEYKGKISNSIEKKFRDAVKGNKNIIVDQTNLTKKSRRKRVSQVKSDIYERNSFTFFVEEKELKKRCESRSEKPISNGVLYSQMKNFIIPSFEEGFDNISYL